MVGNTPKMIEAATNSGRIETESRHRIHSRFKRASHILNMLAYAGCALKEMESDGLAAHIREPSRVKQVTKLAARHGVAEVFEKFELGSFDVVPIFELVCFASRFRVVSLLHFGFYSELLWRGLAGGHVEIRRQVQ